MEKIENIKHPIKKGELYLVPCITREENDVVYVTPVINHPHNDIENGQKETHYHADFRFIKHKNDGEIPTVRNKHSKYYIAEHIRPTKKHGKIEYFVLPVINEKFAAITPSSYIKKSKLKHKCIHKGKCPHRGYDLSQVPDENGIIQCPLHGLKFDSKTKKLIP